MSRLLLIPVETARRRGLELPGSPAEWEQMKCPTCPRMCWVHVRIARRIRTGDATGICTLCALDGFVGESFGRMLRGEDSPEMLLEEARKRFPPMWTIYRPSDMPGVAFASRVWFGEVATHQVMIAATLEGIREKVKAAGGCVCLGRSFHDDPAIVETWV